MPLEKVCGKKYIREVYKSKFVRNRNFEVSVEFTMTYLAILQRFHLYSTYKDFISGLLLGLSIAEMLVGVYVVGKSLTGR